jgi:hypothetical protein
MHKVVRWPVAVGNKVEIRPMMLCAYSATFFSISAKPSRSASRHDRHNEALLGAEGDANVVMVLVNDVVAVDLEVDRRRTDRAASASKFRRGPTFLHRQLG